MINIDSIDSSQINRLTVLLERLVRQTDRNTAEHPEYVKYFTKSATNKYSASIKGQLDNSRDAYARMVKAIEAGMKPTNEDFKRVKGALKVLQNKTDLYALHVMQGGRPADFAKYAEEIAKEIRDAMDAVFGSHYAVLSTPKNIVDPELLKMWRELNVSRDAMNQAQSNGAQLSEIISNAGQETAEAIGKEITEKVLDVYKVMHDNQERDRIARGIPEETPHTYLEYNQSFKGLSWYNKNFNKNMEKFNKWLEDARADLDEKTTWADNYFDRIQALGQKTEAEALKGMFSASGTPPNRYVSASYVNPQVMPGEGTPLDANAFLKLMGNVATKTASNLLAYDHDASRVSGMSDDEKAKFDALSKYLNEDKDALSILTDFVKYKFYDTKMNTKAWTDKQGGTGNAMSALSDAFSGIPILGSVFKGLGKMTDYTSKVDNLGLSGPLSAILKVVGVIAMAAGAVWKKLKESSPILQAVSDLFNLAMTLFFMPIGNALGSLLLPLATDLVNLAIGWNQFLADPFGEMENWFENYLSGEAIIGFITNAITAYFGFLKDNLTSIVNFATAIAGFIGNFWTDVGNFIINAITAYFGFLKDNISNIVNFATAIARFIGNFWANVGTVLNTLINSLATAIANAMKGVVSSATDWVGNTFGNIKLFASGGVVPATPGGTLGLIGEAGKSEAVIPLDELGDYTGNGGITIVFSGTVYGMNDFEDKVNTMIQRASNRAYYR